ncbi:MAG: hypothetical protein ACI9MB_002391 [Verrucomicrobiales bacterium]|jgi:hypothetical protein
MEIEQKLAKIAKEIWRKPACALSSRASVFIALLGFLLLSPRLQAEVEPVSLLVPEAKAWVGQRLAFSVELRARGSFAGSASFDLPRLPGSLLVKIGDPVVGSREIAGENWFIQTHEFALFSQRSGTLEIPPFDVRFARREGFTGPAQEVRAQSSGFSVEIQRPPGSEGIGFLVTTGSLEITESWSPAPGAAQVGAVFKRTITQRAEQVPAMALAPAPTAAADGIRVYASDALTSDKLARGQFLGERSETLTYLVQQSGSIELPALTYVWWNPKNESLESKTLPAVAFEVAPDPRSAPAEETVLARRTWPWILAPLLLVGASIWQRHRMIAWGKKVWGKWNPPDRVAARRLLRACSRDEAAAAYRAWVDWQTTQTLAHPIDPNLRSLVLELQRGLFAAPAPHPWQGDELSRAFRNRKSTTADNPISAHSPVLPPLNPPPQSH